ncbi:hypothetical protein MN608_00194 [Microdochium nivale]|nr:hypothetical protein MN608_00194 [Microdochium nivale]
MQEHASKKKKLSMGKSPGRLGCSPEDEHGRRLTDSSTDVVSNIRARMGHCGEAANTDSRYKRMPLSTTLYGLGKSWITPLLNSNPSSFGFTPQSHTIPL